MGSIPRKAARGLSTCHNRPEHMYRRTSVGTLDTSPYEYHPAQVHCYKGASLVYVSRDRYVIKSREHRTNVRTRGKVRGVSYKSRRRLMLYLGKIDKRVAFPLFVTLTYPDEVYPITDKRFRRDIKVFNQRLMRKYPSVCGWWRKEFKRRISGLYPGVIFPHYHLLLWGIDDLAEFRTWCARAWYEVVGSEELKHYQAGTSAEWVRSWRHMMSYVSKYMAKVDAEELAREFDEPGRMWGVIRRELLPLVDPFLQTLSDRQAIQLIRYLSRYARMQGGKSYKALNVFVNDPGVWWERLEQLVL